MNEKYSFPPVNRDSYKPIYIQVSEMIIDYAKFLKLNPGDALPSENQLLSMLDVSRNTVRLAVDRLVKMNFAKKIRGHGTFICEKEHSVNLDFTQGFEGTLHRLGIKIENKLIEIKQLETSVNWIHGLSMVNGDDPTLIRRIKMSSGNILALEDRILPKSIIERYTREELETENINPTLLGKYPDTDSLRFKYYFVSKPLNQVEADLLKKKKGSHFLQRIGEYYNFSGECFMIGRHIFVSTQIHVSYEFEITGDCCKLT